MNNNESTGALPVSLNPSIYLSYPDDWGVDIAVALQKVKQGWQSVADARKDILADKTLTKEAQLVALDKMYQQRVARHTEQARKALQSAKAVEQSIQSAVAGIFKASNDPAEIALAGEIRAALRAMTPQDRSAALASAVSAGDLSVIRAATSGPEFLTGVSKEKGELVRQEYVRTAHPEIVQHRETAERFARISESAIASLNNLRRDLFTAGDETTLRTAKALAEKTARHLSDTGE